MSIKLPKIIGHRGAAAYAPENTLVSIHTAADMGVDWVELDVKITKDHVPVIFHDEDLERTTNTTGLIAETTYAELKELDAGSWFGESFIGTKIPTLEEAIEVLVDREMGLNLELKPCPGREVETTEAALDILSHFWDDHERLLISSFQNTALETAFDIAQDWSRGLLLPEEWPEDWAEIANYLKVSTIHVNAQSCTREQVQSILALEKTVLAYTLNDPDQANHLQGWGVHGFFSDEPDIIKDGLFTVH